MNIEHRIASVEVALSKLTDGVYFEDFAKQLLANVFGHTFIPVGGTHDRGIDGFHDLLTVSSRIRTIYQLSIERDPVKKINQTLQRLTDAKVQYDIVAYVTNQLIGQQEKLIDTLYDTWQKHVRIYDRKWLATKIIESDHNYRLYQTYIAGSASQLADASVSEIVDFVHDPRLFVFLRQQWDEHRTILQIDEILADTLILYCLEVTDPDQHIFCTRQELRDRIAEYIHFAPHLLYEKIDQRLDHLSRKPRKIIYHSAAKAYCLPYQTRCEIQERNILEAKLYEDFMLEAESLLRRYVTDQRIVIKDYTGLIKKVINHLFYQQGLEFSNFMLATEGSANLYSDKDLSAIIEDVVDDSNVIPKNRHKVKIALLTTIRALIYEGTETQRVFLRKYAQTYMMLFLLHCEPKISRFFSSMASHLRVYVCTSILVPALSEVLLEPQHRRYWSLLEGANRAGVHLYINDTLLEELVNHFKYIKHLYETTYRNDEEAIIADEMRILYIEQIMIRAYFYARKRSQVESFDEFLDYFVNPSLHGISTALGEWLRHTFGIVHRSDTSLGITVSQEDQQHLYEALRRHKPTNRRAQTDAIVALLIYKLREQRNERAEFGVMGYKTWWLSTDTLTYRAIQQVFGDRYPVSCYLRPDFLYNYIVLAPHTAEVAEVYDELFPTLVGVNISFHLPTTLIQNVQADIKRHRAKPIARQHGKVMEAVEGLKTQKSRHRRNLGLWLDDHRTTSLTHEE